MNKRREEKTIRKQSQRLNSLPPLLNLKSKNHLRQVVHHPTPDTKKYKIKEDRYKNKSSLL